MPIRKANAVWEGDLKNGKGRMAFGGGAFEGAYNFGSRFEEGPGTNPEELIAAAHAGCYSMALSNELGPLSSWRGGALSQYQLDWQNLRGAVRISPYHFHKSRRGNVPHALTWHADSCQLRGNKFSYREIIETHNRDVPGNR